MILRIEGIKDICSKVVAALDSTEIATVTDTLLLEAVPGKLTLCVTNREYFAEMILPVDNTDNFVATVNANLFLKLIAQTTADTVELTINNNNLVVKGNGTYKLPLIYDGDKLLELPRIELNNVTSEMKIDGNVLNSIIAYNAKQLDLGQARVEAQKYYYFDQDGCITATGGACVNNFKLDKPCRLLLNRKLVKLFKLFKGEEVSFKLAYDAISEDVIQTKVAFETSDVKISAILSCDDTVLNTFPEPQVRALANKEFDYSVTMHKNELLETINRLLLFEAQSMKPYGKFTFKANQVAISDSNEASTEELFYQNDTSGISDSYSTMIDLKEFKALLETCTEQYVCLTFGDHRAIVVSRGSVKNIIQECTVL